MLWIIGNLMFSYSSSFEVYDYNCVQLLIQAASDQILTWHDGCTVPSLQVPVSESKDPEDEEKQVTDAELVKKDVVKVS